MSDKPVLLRRKGSKESQPFEAGHAQRLLAYPNTQWEEADKQAAPPVRTAATSAKTPAAAATKKPAAAAPASPEADTTGHPTSI